MCEDETAEAGDFDRATHCRCGIVRNAEQRERSGLRGVIASLDRCELRRLVFERVKAVLVAEKHLQRHQNDEQAQRHPDHHSRVLDGAPAAQQPSADTHHHKRGGDVKSRDIVKKPIGKRGTEYDR